MLGTFWESLGGKLAERWAAAAAPALVFWVGGLLAWVSAGPGLRRLSNVARWLDRQSVTVQVMGLIGGLLVIVASALVVERLTTPMLRLLEGYWPRWADRPRRSLVDRAQRRAEADEKAWQEFQSRPHSAGGPSGGDLAQMAALEMRIHYRPSAANRVMPTQTGNILRAAETRPTDKYGLDAVVVWPRLWLVMSDSARQEIGSSRGSLDSAAATVVWGLLFCMFVPLAWWALPVGLAIATQAIVWWVPNRAKVFANLVEAAYDLHRSPLYKQLRWPLPATPRDEQVSGRQLTAYLWRGSDTSDPRFTSTE